MSAVAATTLFDEQELRSVFDTGHELTIGLEEEVLLLDPHTHQPVPLGDEVVRRAADPRVKRELPACQVELFTRPHPDVASATAELAEARGVLRQVCGAAIAPAAAAVHPTCQESAVLSSADRHQQIGDAYGEVARRQMVGALQVHVALGSADRSLAVYNTLRGFLPEVAALAAAAPYYEGRDTGLASIRPVISAQLPRQGVPPAIESWSRFAADLRWGSASGSVPEPRQWWWELRPHVIHGTLEVRVPDVQATEADTAAVAQVVHALVAWLADAFDQGRPLPVASTWRIAENRWSALRDGVHGTLADLESGAPVPTSRRLHQVLDDIEPFATAGLDAPRALIGASGADALRSVPVADAAASLIERF
ncbi:MAG: glutamate--cysteine ligase [Ilumatobacteraceae bacterium]|nr:glutamate--cysteine ligase [Ilumatobacteraceae bacterium]